MNTYAHLFEEFSNQNLATQILSSSIRKNHIAPAYLFTGPKGVGQKKIALRFLNIYYNNLETRQKIDSPARSGLTQLLPKFNFSGTFHVFLVKIIFWRGLIG